MALEVKVGSFVQPASTGNSDVTGVGFQPKVVFFFTLPVSADGAAVHSHVHIGVMDGTNEEAGSWAAEDGVATASSNLTIGFDHAIDSWDHTLSVVARADFVSFLADGFRLNWIHAGNSQVINYLALGGDDLTDIDIRDITSPGATGNQAYTGVGFQPDFLLVFGTGDSSSNQDPDDSWGSLGLASGPSNQSSYGFNVEGAGSPSEADRNFRTDRIWTPVLSGTTLLEAALTSFDADGFTLNWSKISGTRDLIAVSLKGGQYHVGADTQKTSTGTKATTGVGFQPKGILGFSGNHTDETDQTDQSLSMFAGSDPTERFGSWTGVQDGVNPTVADMYLTRTNLLRLMSPGGTLDAEADLDSLDADGFTLNWGTADAVARDFSFVAFGDADGGGGGEEPTTHQFMPLLGVG